MNIEQINALNRFALKHLRGWKRRLSSAWLSGNYPVGTTDEDKALLQQLRNNGGPNIVEVFRPVEAGFRKLGFLKPETCERFNLRRAWHATAWRIVDDAGVDMIQPWDMKKADAKSTALDNRIFLAGTLA